MIRMHLTSAHEVQDGNPEIYPIPGATTENRVRENAKIVDLSYDELAKFDALLESFEVAGARYPAHAMGHVDA
jgi:pyridoxine 4-dehydrogenase